MSLRPFLFLAALVAGGSTVQAQSAAAFYPLNDGDTWTYERIRIPNRQIRNTSTPLLDGYRRVMVVGDTVVSNESYKKVNVEYLRFSMDVDSTARCIVRVAGNPWSVEWQSVRGTCGAPESGLALGGISPVVQSYSIASMSYSGKVIDAESIGFVENVGVVSSWVSGGLYGLFNAHQMLLLASVEGVVYGGMPGPSEWRAFQPLAVGDRWAYRTWTRYQQQFESLEVVGDTLVSGSPYFRVRAGGSGSGQFQTRLWRYRDDLGCVAERLTNESEACRSNPLAGAATLTQNQSVQIGNSSYQRNAIRILYWDGSASGSAGSIDVVEGIGLVERSNSAQVNDFQRTQLEYARVGGTEYGTQPSWATWATPAEAEAPTARVTLRVLGPNPTAGAVGIQVVSETVSRVTLAVFDALGRRVLDRQETVGAGEQTLTLDLSRQAPGVYVVRLTSPDAAPATVPVTVY